MFGKILFLAVIALAIVFLVVAITGGDVVFFIIAALLVAAGVLVYREFKVSFRGY